MSYDYSFQKSQIWLLGTLTVLMAALLITTGFLIGRITVTPSDTMVAGRAGAIAAPGAAASPAPPTALPTTVVPLAGASTAPSTPVAASSAPVEITSAGSGGGTATGRSGVDVYTLNSPGYTLQYGAFRDPSNARELMKQLSEQKVIAFSVTMTNGSGEAYSVVRSGAYPTISGARQAAVEQANKLRMPVVVRPAGRL